MTVFGEYTLQCTHKGEQHRLNFKIAPGHQKPLLSGETCTKMGLITINDINQEVSETPRDTLVKEYDDVFEGLGCLPGEYHIEIVTKIPPVQHSPRHAPVALKEKLKQKLQELKSKGIIAKVEKSTPWISSLVAVLKPGKIRVCINPRDLIKAIKRPKYQIPTLEEILPQLAEAKIFSVLDAKDGFH